MDVAARSEDPAVLRDALGKSERLLDDANALVKKLAGERDAASEVLMQHHTSTFQQMKEKESEIRSLLIKIGAMTTDADQHKAALLRARMEKEEEIETLKGLLERTSREHRLYVDQVGRERAKCVEQFEMEREEYLHMVKVKEKERCAADKRRDEVVHENEELQNKVKELRQRINTIRKMQVLMDRPYAFPLTSPRATLFTIVSPIAKASPAASVSPPRRGSSLRVHIGSTSSQQKGGHQFAFDESIRGSLASASARLRGLADGELGGLQPNLDEAKASLGDHTTLPTCADHDNVVEDALSEQQEVYDSFSMDRDAKLDNELMEFSWAQIEEDKNDLAKKRALLEKERASILDELDDERMAMKAAVDFKLAELESLKREVVREREEMRRQQRKLEEQEREQTEVRRNLSAALDDVEDRRRRLQECEKALNEKETAVEDFQENVEIQANRVAKREEALMIRVDILEMETKELAALRDKDAAFREETQAMKAYLEADTAALAMDRAAFAKERREIMDRTGAYERLIVEKEQLRTKLVVTHAVLEERNESYEQVLLEMNAMVVEMMNKDRKVTALEEVQIELLKSRDEERVSSAEEREAHRKEREASLMVLSTKEKEKKAAESFCDELRGRVYSLEQEARFMLQTIGAAHEECSVMQSRLSSVDGCLKAIDAQARQLEASQREEVDLTALANLLEKGKEQKGKVMGMLSRQDSEVEEAREAAVAAASITAVATAATTATSQVLQVTIEELKEKLHDLQEELVEARRQTGEGSDSDIRVKLLDQQNVLCEKQGALDAVRMKLATLERDNEGLKRLVVTAEKDRSFWEKERALLTELITSTKKESESLQARLEKVAHELDAKTKALDARIYDREGLKECFDAGDLEEGQGPVPAVLSSKGSSSKAGAKSPSKGAVTVTAEETTKSLRHENRSLKQEVQRLTEGTIELRSTLSSLKVAFEEKELGVFRMQQEAAAMAQATAERTTRLLDSAKQLETHLLSDNARLTAEVGTAEAFCESLTRSKDDLSWEMKIGFSTTLVVFLSFHVYLAWIGSCYTF